MTFSDYDIGIIGKDVKDDIGVRTKNDKIQLQ